MTHLSDPTLSIGAARQAAANYANQPSQAPARIRHHPRKLIGFDLIKGLHDIAWSRVGQKYAYEHCAVQRDRDGNILADFNLDTMRVIKTREDLSYGQLIHHAIDEAQRIAVRLGDMSPEMRFERLNGFVKEAGKDGRMAWVLSAACLRSLIFPQSYNGKRSDDVRYKFIAKDEACGKPIYLDSLQPNHVNRFLTHAEQMCPTILLATITPITADQNQ